jgi:hypothetical protein
MIVSVRRLVQKLKVIINPSGIKQSHGGIYLRSKGLTGGLASDGLSAPATGLDVGELSWDLGDCVRLGGAPGFEGQAMWTMLPWSRKKRRAYTGLGDALWEELRREHRGMKVVFK